MNFNCKLYYYLSWFEGSTVNRNRLYSQIWKSKAPHRSKAFLWLVGNDALLTNFVRKKRNLTVNDFFAVLLLRQRSTLFVIVQKRKRCGTVMVLVALIKYLFFQQPLGLRLENNLMNDTQVVKGIDWPLVFMTGCYLVLQCSNLAILEDVIHVHTIIDCRVFKLA